MLPDQPSNRRLTSAEQRQLAELERRLTEDDPGFIATFDAAHPGAVRLPRWAQLAFLLVGCGLVVAAAVVGGFGGAAAVVASLLLTAVTVALPRLARRRRPVRATPSAPSAPTAS